MMVDNLGKNMMMDTWDNKIFYPRFYDCDTICSYDNSGQLKFDVDIEMAQGYWNTSSSRLWTRIRDLMHDELVEKYNNMRQNGLSYESLMECFYDEQIAKIPQKYYNQDYDVKYAPFADSYIGMANGDTYEHLKRWLQQRLRFVDTLYDYAPSYNNDVLTIRANTTEPMTLEIETYTPVYQHLSWYNNQMDKKKIDGKTSVTFTGKAMAETDQEVLIYGGSNIKSIKGITSMNPNRMLIGSATRLIELDAPNCPLLADINANKANLAPHVYLNKVNLSGCPLLGGNLIINQSPLIREIDIRNTAITGLNLSSNLRNLEILKLPATIPNLILNDASQLHTLEFEEVGTLQNVSMTNCNALTNVTNFDLSNAQQVTLNNSYNATNELYLKNASTLSLSNMSNLEKVIYTPNAEHETFDITNLANTKDYNITTFNCPKLNTFMTTAPYRESYGKEYGEVKPNEVFEANTIDISNTQFTDVKLLCTTDTNVLKLPQTVKNLIIDSSYDLDTEYLTDGDYSTIHADLYEPYNTDYEGEVLLNGKTPNIIPSASDGSLIFSMYVPAKTIQPASGVWDLKGLELEEYHTFGLNNDIKTHEEVQESDFVLGNTDGLRVRNNYVVREYEGLTSSTGRTIQNICTTSEFLYFRTNDGSPATYLSYSPGQATSTGIVRTGIGTSVARYSISIMNTVEYVEFTGKDSGITYRYYINDITTTSLPADRFDPVPVSPSETQLEPEIITVISMPDRYDEYSIQIKNPTIPNEIARYTASDWNTFPIFNSEFIYTYDITQLDNETYYYSIMADSMDNLPTSISFNGKSSLLTVEYLKVTSKVTSMYQMFTNCTNLTSLDVSNWDTSKVNSMSSMFQGCNNLTTLDVSNFDTQNVTTMYQMFYNCNKLTSLDVSNWDTSEVTNMYQMFTNCTNLTSLDVSNFDTSNVTNMNSMFSGCTNLTTLDVSNFDTSEVTDMGSMFYGCNKLASIEGIREWDTSKVAVMSGIFQRCDQLTSLNLSGWNTSQVTDMRNMFHICGNLTSLDLSGWDTSKVTSATGVFYLCNNLTSLNVEMWPLNDITQTVISSLPVGDDTKNEIQASAYFTIPSGWTLINILEIARYTCNASGVLPTFNNEYSGYSTQELENEGIYTVRIATDSMDNLPTSINFSGKSSLLTVEYLNTSNVTTMSGMFQNCTNLTSLDVSNFDTSEVTNINNMFFNCSNLTSLNLSNFITNKITTMSNIFNGCSNLISLDLSNFNTQNVTDINGMFLNCRNLTSLNLSNWDTSNVTDMNSIFLNCNNLTTLDISNFDTSNVTNMKSMFYNCNKLTSLDLSNFDTENVTNMYEMFYNCTKLTSLDLSNFDTSEVTNMSYMFHSCNNLTSLDVSNWDTGKVTSMYGMFNGCSSLTSLDSMQNIPISLSLSSTKLDQTSLIDIINNLATIATTQTLTLGATLLAKLTEEQIAVAVNKGWTVA